MAGQKEPAAMRYALIALMLGLSACSNPNAPRTILWTHVASAGTEMRID
jgi:hypothetical protein